MLKKCLAVSVMSIVAAQASAQSNFSELLVFGDSLLDSGNVSGNRFTNKVGDFSTGEFAAIAPQLLAGKLGLSLAPATQGGTNYAVGGFRNQDIFNSVAGDGLRLGPSQGDPVLPPYLANNPNISGSSLVLIDGGGNDLRDILFQQPPELAPDLIKASAQTLVGTIGALSSSGAKYIMVSNVPDLGATPGVQAFNVTAPGTAVAVSAATQGYNDGVQTFSNFLSDANIIPVDLNGLVNYVIANSESYGLVSGDIDLGGGLMFDSSYMCFDDGASPGAQGSCIEHPIYGIDGVTPDPSKLFFNDDLHPTAIGSEIAGDYLADIILAPQKIGLLPELALNASRAQVAVTSNELRQSRWDDTLTGGLFITGDITTAEYDLASTPETETVGLTVGYTHAASDKLLIGAALTVGNQELDVDGASFEADSFALTGLIGYRNGNIFADTSIGITRLSYDDLSRDVKLGSQTLTATGETDGYTWALDTLVGYDVLSSEKFHLAPAIGVSWLNASVDGYTESGGGVSNYTWYEQSRKSLQWRYGVVAGMEVAQGVEIFAEVFGSQEEEDDLQSVSILNTNLNYSAYELPSYQADGDSFVTGTVGAFVELGGSNLNLTWNYSDRGEGFEQVLLTYSMPM